MATEINSILGYKVVRAGFFDGNTIFGSACASREDLRSLSMGLKPIFDWSVLYMVGKPTLFGMDAPGFAFDSLKGAKLGARILGRLDIDMRIFAAELVLIDNMDNHPHMWQPSDELRPFTELCLSIKLVEEVK